MDCHDLISSSLAMTIKNASIESTKIDYHDSATQNLAITILLFKMPRLMIPQNLAIKFLSLL